MKKGVLRNFTKFTAKRLCQSLFYNIEKRLFLRTPQTCNFIKKETLTQLLSCEICEISNNSFFSGHLWTTVSEFFRMISIGIYLFHLLFSFVN